MPEPKRTFDEKIKAISGGLMALTGILAAITQFNENLKKILDSLGPVAGLPIIWLLVAAILFIVGVFTLRDGLARRSRLLRPEALLLKADNPAHLKGRSEDIQRLATLCYEVQQVHLVGESGAGKSALRQAGLCPVLKAEKKLFPIYLDVWGQDWQEGPRTALIHALWEALSEEDRKIVELAALPEPGKLAAMLAQCRAKLRRVPLVIFDQFDDYQTRHRARFLAGRRRTWISADTLSEANAFWGDVKKLIDEQTVHCLFATRSDTADGLESIRFVTPQVYRLDRLNADFVRPLLTELTAPRNGEPPIVFAPDRGWARLQERLVRDLSEDRVVLPVQMKMALQGLSSLRSLTIRDYERAGGLHGLEAAHVERHAVNTARHTALTRMQIQTLLTSLVDANTLKAVPKPSITLVEALASGDESGMRRIRKAVEEALDDLEQKEILRKRFDPDARQHVWVLDHDYLCHGVLELERRANRWFALAQEGHRTFQDPGGIWRKWRSLLGPGQQMRLAAARLQGRFRYGALRSYAAWSLCRWVPYLLVLTAVVYGWVENRQQWQATYDQRAGARLSDEILLYSYEQLSLKQLLALWDLAESNDAVRDSFLVHALDHPLPVEQFNRHVDMAMQAAVGLDPDRREKVFHDVVSPCLQRPPPALSIKVACVKIALELSIAGRYPDFSSFAVATFIEAIEEIPDSDWKTVVQRLTPADAYKARDLLLAAMERTADPFQLLTLAQVLATVPTGPGELAAAEAQWVFTRLLEAIEWTSDPGQLGALAQALGAVPGELAAAEAQWVFARLLALMERTGASFQLMALVQAFRAVPGDVELQTLIDVLKWPISVGTIRSELLKRLERQTHKKFDGDLWKMVAWAQAHGLDVKSPPRRRGLSSTSR